MFKTFAKGPEEFAVPEGDFPLHAVIIFSASIVRDTETYRPESRWKVFLATYRNSLQALSTIEMLEMRLKLPVVTCTRGYTISPCLFTEEIKMKITMLTRNINVYIVAYESIQI